jgi:polyribonucleotide nucleotidyltransferase
MYKKISLKRVRRSSKRSSVNSRSNSERMDALVETIYEETEGKFDKKQILNALTKYNYMMIRENILKKQQRPDGRKIDQVRDLHIEAGLLPRTHGSALFQRGQTQILSIVTLGSTTLEQLIEGRKEKKQNAIFIITPMDLFIWSDRTYVWAKQKSNWTWSSCRKSN